MNIKHVLNISGGKDSTAMWIHALELGVAPIAVFADTGHEHPLTLEFLENLERRLGPLRRVRADFSTRLAVKRRQLPAKWRAEGIAETRIERAIKLLRPTGIPFLDLCLLKARFPSSRARFCSQELKHLPIRAQIVDPLLDAGYTVHSWLGIRNEESQDREITRPLTQIDERLLTFCPVLNWTTEEVFAAHGRVGIEPNPLYKQGAVRVGCAPCFMVRKDELRNLAQRWPAEIERVAAWEALVAETSKRRRASFVPWRTTPSGSSDPDAVQPNVREVAFEWAFTKHGGRERNPAADVPPSACVSAYGLCE